MAEQHTTLNRTLGLQMAIVVVLIINTLLIQPREAIIGLSLVAAGIPCICYF